MTIYSISIAKAGKSLEVNWDEVPDAIKERIIEHGLTQKLNDAHAGINAETKVDSGTWQELALELSSNVLENILAGDWAKRAVANPLQRELRLVLSAVYKQLLGAKPADMKGMTIESLAAGIAKKKEKPVDRVIEHFTSIAKTNAETKAKAQAAIAAAAKQHTVALDEL